LFDLFKSKKLQFASKMEIKTGAKTLAKK